MISDYFGVKAQQNGQKKEDENHPSWNSCTESEDNSMHKRWWKIVHHSGKTMPNVTQQFIALTLIQLMDLDMTSKSITWNYRQKSLCTDPPNKKNSPTPSSASTMPL